MSEPQPNNPETKSKMSRSVLMSGLAVAAVLSVLALAAMMIMGPLVGNVFSTINSSLGSFDGSYASTSPNDETGKAGMEIMTERLIIRNGEISIVVEDPLATQKEIEQLVAEMTADGAFVVSNNVDSSAAKGLPYVYLTIRVPAKNFDKTMERLTGMAVEVRHKTATAQDVTAEYVDLKARLEALEAARRRLLQIMQESTTTEALLLAEKELTAREADLEAIKGRMQYLSESAQLSSITIELIPDALSQPVVTGWRPSETVRQSFDMLVNGLRAFADFLILFVIAILPWLALLYGIYRLIKRFTGFKL
jgi:hypothetical protein